MAKKSLHFHEQSEKEFAQQLMSLCDTKSSWEVWSDFVTMSALTIANAFDREGKIHDKREKEYLRIISQYAKAKQQVFPELFARLVDALDKNPEQDFLGKMCMVLGLGNHWKGQFFTPYSLCQMMAAITISDKEEQMKERGWVGIHDACCGAGALLIAARNEMIRRGFGPRQALYVAQDIDRTAALMCYLQLSLLGCAGYVVVGDAITQPLVGPTGSLLLITPTEKQEFWLMPAFYDKVWTYRVQFEKAMWLMMSKDRE